MRDQHAMEASVLETEAPAISSVEAGSPVTLNEPYAPLPEGENEAEAVLNQVDRILRSDELRGCEALRRLLKFLATKSLDGSGDDLKEYSVAIDGLGKPATYDPRQNSAVRIQVGRLRQKLADYYRTEGQNDPVLIELPKGRFKLKFEYRDASISTPLRVATTEGNLAVLPHRAEEPAPRGEKVKRLRAVLPSLAAALLGVAIGVSFHWFGPGNAKASAVTTRVWNPDMEALWKPFIATRRPLIVAIEDPLFVELKGNPGIYYRDKALNDWNAVRNSASMAAVQRSLKASFAQPSRYYTAYGEVEASFQVAKLLGPRVQNLAVVKTSDLSLQQLADNNVLFVGVQNLFFTEQAQAAPVDAPLQPVLEGIRNLHPGPNEPAIFKDEFSTAPSEEGVVYALVTHFPGPMGHNDVESFTSNRSAGYVAAVKAFTDPEFVSPLVARLKESCGGHMPEFYQVLLKVKFKDEVPTEITYVLARELHNHGES